MRQVVRSLSRSAQATVRVLREAAIAQHAAELPQVPTPQPPTPKPQTPNPNPVTRIPKP